jgi:hypothetical protein
MELLLNYQKPSSPEYQYLPWYKHKVLKFEVIMEVNSLTEYTLSHLQKTIV